MATAVAGVGAAVVEFARRHPFDPAPAAVRWGTAAPPVPHNAVRGGVREHAHLQAGAAG